MRIGLFIPCFIDAFFPEVGVATLELLERFGHEVVYPRDQTFCGQPMADNGFNADAAATEALFVRNFSGCDYVVAPRVAASTMCATILMRSSRQRR
jgi:L-lactate dehydrogenase complex protein LldE